jgi:hypothetical protein
MRSEPILAAIAFAAFVAGCAAMPRPAPTPALPSGPAVPVGWFASADELCDSIRRAARAADEKVLAALVIPESLWVASTWHFSETRAAAKDSAHERASREFARWLHQSNDRKGRKRLIQALRDNPDTASSGCPSFAGQADTVGPLELHSFAAAPAGKVRLAGSLARMGNAWRVHSYAEAGAKR